MKNHEEQQQQQQDFFNNNLLFSFPEERESVIEAVSREASYRWAHFLQRIPKEEQVKQFAMVGSVRMLEWLLRENMEFSVQNILRGLTHGKSGNNHPLEKFNNTRV